MPKEDHENSSSRFASDLCAAASLDAWRRKAVGIYLVASAVVYLPGIVLVFAGFHPSIGWQVKTVAAGAYLSFPVAAVWRRAHSPTRVWATLALAYLLAITAAVVGPHGPFLRTLPVVLPTAALVLVGSRSARVAALISAPVILFSPFLRAVPGATTLLAAGPPEALPPAGVSLVQGAVLVAMMLTLTSMVECFHQFLIKTLSAQRQAASDAEREAIELAEAHTALAREMNERRRLERANARASDEERRRLGQDVHDGVCQLLTGALLRCQALERHVTHGRLLRREDLSALSSLLEEAIDEAHALAEGLWPLEPDPEALAAALRVLTRRTRQAADIRCEFIATGDWRVFDAVTAQHLHRIAQEALSNAVRHAQASRVVVELSGDDCEVRLEVLDDGVGLPAELPADGMGLRTMASRAQIMDGELTVAPATGKGTRVTCRVPRYARLEENGEPSETRERRTDGS